MYDYLIRDHDYQLIVVGKHRQEILNQSIQAFFNAQLQSQLTNFETRLKVTKKYLGFKAKVPLYINENCLWMCIRSYRHPACFYINQRQIKSYHREGNDIVVLFYSQHMLRLTGHRSFFNQLEKCRQIDEWMKK